MSTIFSLTCSTKGNYEDTTHTLLFFHGTEQQTYLGNLIARKLHKTIVLILSHSRRTLILRDLSKNYSCTRCPTAVYEWDIRGGGILRHNTGRRRQQLVHSVRCEAVSRTNLGSMV